MVEKTPLILIVDDDPDYLEMTRSILETGGYRVACARGPEQALEMMMGDRPNLVITDLMMQTMGSGFSLSRRIKENPRCWSVPVIVVTAAASRLGYDFTPRSPEDLAAMHADAFIQKPTLREELLAKVADLLPGGGKEEGS